MKIQLRQLPPNKIATTKPAGLSHCSPLVTMAANRRQHKCNVPQGELAVESIYYVETQRGCVIRQAYWMISSQ